MGETRLPGYRPYGEAARCIQAKASYPVPLGSQDCLKQEENYGLRSILSTIRRFFSHEALKLVTR